MEELARFPSHHIKTINNATAMAEEVVSNYYKMSASEWLRPKYDVKTLVDLDSAEIVHGPFAQIIRYEGRKGDTELGSTAYDFYKICLQDHAILAAMDQNQDLELFPFALYIVAHELIHIVRFSRFLQNFDASPEEKMIEEQRVHTWTHDILQRLNIRGLKTVLAFYAKWRFPLEDLAQH
jgi:hypothetical protein